MTLVYSDSSISIFERDKDLVIGYKEIGEEKVILSGVSSTSPLYPRSTWSSKKIVLGGSTFIRLGKYLVHVTSSFSTDIQLWNDHIERALRDSWKKEGNLTKPTGKGDYVEIKRRQWGD